MASLDFMQSLSSNPVILIAGAVILFFILLVLVVAVSFFIGRRKYKASSYPARDTRIVLNKDDFPDMETDEPAASETSEAAARPSRAPSASSVRSVEEDDVVYMAPAKKAEPVLEINESVSSGSVESVSSGSVESVPEDRFVYEPAAAAAAAEPVADDGVEIYEDDTPSVKRDEEPNPFIIDFRREDHAPAQVSESPGPNGADRETADTRITFEEIRLSPASAVNENVAVPAAVDENVAVSAAVDENVAVPAAVDENVAVPAAVDENEFAAAAPDNSAVPEDVPILAPAEVGSDASGDDADGGVEIWDDIKPEDEAPAAKRTHKYAYFDAVLQEEKEREALKRASAVEPAAEETSVSEEMPDTDDLSAADDAPSDDPSYGAASEDSTAQTTVSEKKDDDTANLPDPDY